MRLIHKNQKIREDFPLKQFSLGEKVFVKMEEMIQYQKNFRIFRILNERLYEVQDQDNGDVFEVCINHLFRHFEDNPVNQNRYQMY